MKHYTTNKRYCPHEITTKLKSVQLYRQTKDISYVCRKYKISKASLMRWNKQYDGTKESLMPKSHRPHSPHPNAHTEQEIKWIKDYHRRNPNISLGELYGKLREDLCYEYLAASPTFFTFSFTAHSTCGSNCCKCFFFVSFCRNDFLGLCYCTTHGTMHALC